MSLLVFAHEAAHDGKREGQHPELRIAFCGCFQTRKAVEKDQTPPSHPASYATFDPHKPNLFIDIRARFRGKPLMRAEDLKLAREFGRNGIAHGAGRNEKNARLSSPKRSSDGLHQEHYL